MTETLLKSDPVSWDQSTFELAPICAGLVFDLDKPDQATNAAHE
jgi:hypothetical protein